MNNSCILIMFCFLWTFFAKSASLTCNTDNQNEANHEKRLKNALFCHYDNFIRPGDSTKATIVTIRLNVKDIDYDDELNIIKISSWMTLTWNDNRLIWNSVDYGGIGSIHMKSDYLWKPDMLLFNAHIPSALGTCHVTDCLVSNSSRVACVQPCTFKALCKNNVGIVNFPYDVQNCSLIFGSWMKTGEELNYNAEKITLFTKRAKQNNLWKLIDSSFVYNKGYYSSTNETLPSVTFIFILERHNGLHQMTTISSGIILMICNLLGLFLSPESMIRMLYFGANIYANNLFMDFLNWMIPFSGDKIPNVLTFFGDLQFCSTLLLIQSLILKSMLSFTEKTPVWMMNLVQKISLLPFSNFYLKNTSKLPEDANELVKQVKEQAADKSIVKNFVRLVDHGFIILMIVLSSFMFWTLFPKGYLSSNYNPIDILA